MRAFLFVLAIVVLLLLAWFARDLSERSVDHDTVRVVATWGRVAPPYVVDGAATSTTTTQPRARTAPTKRTTMRAAGVHPCGPEFDLPPCYVMQRESGGDINAYNPTGCGGRGCRGKWQCDPRTCSGTGTEEQQDAEARAIWNHGAGCSHWAAC